MREGRGEGAHAHTTHCSWEEDRKQMIEGEGGDLATIYTRYICLLVHTMHCSWEGRKQAMKENRFEVGDTKLVLEEATGTIYVLLDWILWFLRESE